MNTIRKTIASALIAGATLTAGVAGVGLLNGTASAQTATSTAATASAGATGATGSTGSTGATDQAFNPRANPAAPADGAPDRPDFDPAKGGHVGRNGQKEELLTGDQAAKVSAAALAAQPGATIERVETDAEGAAFEAHLVTADGKHVTVKFDAAYAVTATESGPGR